MPLGAPRKIGEGCKFHSFTTNTYKMHFLESPSGIKVGGGCVGVWLGRRKGGSFQRSCRARWRLPLKARPPPNLLHRAAP
jgi:hypothetical protein